jgi:hypothetical protein
MINPCYVCSASVSYGLGPSDEMVLCCGRCSGRLWKRHDGGLETNPCRFSLSPQYKWNALIEEMRLHPPCPQCGEIHQ